jgi:mannose-6-phosphate isomerase-like protein (cupin superfamily)
MKNPYQDIPAYTTRDGSEIRELMHPDGANSAAAHSQQQSLAEAVVKPGQKTLLHRHHQTEEIYHVTQGEGLMTLAGKQFDVGIGDTLCIAPGTPHCIENTGKEDLHILCCCSPAYSHGDTELL